MLCCNVKGVVSWVNIEKILTAFSAELRVVSSQKPVIATRQEKLFTLVKIVWRYDIPFPISQKLQTHRHTYTQNTAINLIDNPDTSLKLLWLNVISAKIFLGEMFCE